MKTLFFDSEQRLRNGWWMLIFVAVFMGVRFLIEQPRHYLLHGLGLDKRWLEGLPFLVTLLATWVCLRLRKQTLADVGLRPTARWWREAGIGLAIGIGTLLLVVAIIAAIGGVRLELNPARSLAVLGYGLYMFAFVALFEETLFRGFLFQRLVDGSNVWIAQIAFGLFFAIAHWANPGMTGATKVWATLDIFVAALMLGVAYLRTGRLALPIGIHLGWNWAQGYLLGFGVSGVDMQGWWQPVFLGKAEWLTGGQFGAEASVFAAIVDTATLVVLLRWRGTRADSVAQHRLREAVEAR